MSAFDDLTLGEVEDIQKTCLGGKPFTEADPLALAGAVMWTVRRKQGDAVEWDDFRYRTTMGEIKRFSETEMADEADPTKPPES